MAGQFPVYSGGKSLFWGGIVTLYGIFAEFYKVYFIKITAFYVSVLNKILFDEQVTLTPTADTSIKVTPYMEMDVR